MKDYNIRKIKLDEIDSTNQYAMSLPVPGENEIDVITAESQTAGRGQRGNSWESEKGKNLTFTIQCSPRFVKPARQFSILQAKALAIYDVLSKIVPDVSIKWPNDIYIGDCKVCGTLIECEIENGEIKRAIIGSGINVNQKKFFSDAPNPVSLANVAKKDFERDVILDMIVSDFLKYYMMLYKEKDFSDLYANALYRRNGIYWYRDEKGEFEAEISRVEPGGHLVLLDTEGAERRYAFKEVSFVINKQKNRK